MDNDIKIKESKNQIHKDVLLFLNKELEQIQQTSDNNTYNLEEEYGKTKNNKSPFTYIVLFICFFCVAGIALIMNAVISKQNENITVNLQEFDDLNLRTLLDTVSKVQNSYDQAVQEKTNVVAKMEQELSRAKAQKDNDLFLLESLKLSKSAKAKQVEAIENQHKLRVSAIHSEYDPQVAALDSKIKTVAEQLGQFDNSKVQDAREKEKAFEAERQLYEIDKQKVRSEYEARIKDLNNTITDMQIKHDEELRSSINRLVELHKKELATYDPVLNDSTANSIVAKTKETSKEPFDAAQLKESGIYINSSVSDAIDAFEKLYNDYSYLDSKYKPMPHKNSVVEYKATSNQIVNQMGVDFTNAISSVAQKSDQLQTELNASQQALINEQKWFESCLEGILSFANTNAIVLKANAQDDIQIYVAKKARYLVKDEDGVGAELRLQKPIKGRIYKSLEKEGAFNFVPNPDKEGNPVEVDLSIIFSGTAVKVLSK